MKIKTSWELNRLFYKSLTEPKLMRDVDAGDKAVDAFVETYSKNTSWLTSPKSLAKALTAYEALILKCPSAPMLYPNYRKELDAKDKVAEALMNKLDESFTKRGNKTLFFELQLAKVSAEMQKKFLASAELKEFQYWLKHLFENAKHNLSEPEERTLSLLSDVSFGRWIAAVDNLLNTRSVVYKKKKIALNAAQAMLSTLGLKERRVLHTAIMHELRGISDVAESELNAIVTRKKITDEMRGFEMPYDATIIGYENDRASVVALVESVTKHFNIAHRFYKVKAKMLKQKSLTYADRSAPVGAIKKRIPFAEAAQIVHDTFAKLSPRYAKIFEDMLANGQIDVYPKLGKTGGAYCSGMVGQPTMVLLNHVDNAHALLTLAHEMGHAIHTELSKAQRPMYQGYSTVTAETASTFFEGVAFDALVGKLSEKEKIIALHDRLQDDIASIFRQIACFNFETQLHMQIREKGLLPKEAIAELMNKHMSAYLGPAVKMHPDDGYFFVAWSHIRRFFYVYSYAYGQLVSRALRERVKKDPKFIKNIDAFLQAGGSASPEEIFAKCGLDLLKPGVFLEGLKSIERDVQELEKALIKY